MRGQAFETMMLVISVIVAIVILGVLLNILHIIDVVDLSSPMDTMKKGLKEVQSSGYGTTTPQKVTFSEGSTIMRGAVIVDIPLQVEDIRFVCGDQTICGEGDSSKPLNIVDNKLLVKSKIQAYLVVCGNEKRAQRPLYCISVARIAGDATAKCTAGCGLQS